MTADDPLAAAYVNLGEKEPTHTYEQLEIVAQRDALIDGILDDMARIAQGAHFARAGRGQSLRLLRSTRFVPQDYWKD